MSQPGTGFQLGRGKAMGWTVIFLLSGGGLAFLLLTVFTRVLPDGQSVVLATNPTTGAVLVQGLILAAAFGVATWVIGVRVMRLRPAALGLPAVATGIRGLGRGVFLGAIPAVAAMALAVPVGGASWQFDGGTAAAWGAVTMQSGAALLPAALAEELIFRGLPLAVCGLAFGRPGAIVALAVLFAAGHAANPGIGWLGALNIALAGVLLGVAFFLPGGLWTATGTHLGWNLSLAALGAPVSGLPLPLPGLDYVAGAPRWLTGGGFGPEGGLLATLTLSGTILVAARALTHTKERDT